MFSEKMVRPFAYSAVLQDLSSVCASRSDKPEKMGIRFSAFAMPGVAALSAISFFVGLRPPLSFIQVPPVVGITYACVADGILRNIKK
jgi:hypothetical protein